jgi:hypothetical protein
VLDAYGWFAPNSTYVSLEQPTRMLDTRASRRGALEASGDVASPFASNSVRRYVLSGVAGIPATGASALALNITAVTPDGNGEIRVYPCATVNSTSGPSPITVFSTDVTRAAGGTVSLNADGGFCVRSTAATHVVIDVSGYYTNLNYSPFAPTGLPVRLIDTRSGIRGSLEAATDVVVPLAAATTYRWSLAGTSGLPSADGLAAIRLTVVALTAASAGNITVWPCDSVSEIAPSTSLFNFRAGIPISGSAILQTSVVDGGICVRSTQTTHVAVHATHWLTG